MILSLTFVSCDNFLKGAETAKQIEDAIAYANASPYLIRFASQEGTGTIAKPAGGEALKKVSDTFEIKFETSTDYEFLLWEASSKKLPAGSAISDYIEIEDVQSAETKVTFKKELEDIVITAKVSDRPRIISRSPITSGVLKDSSIVVLFNRDMDSSSIYYTDQEITALQEESVTLLTTSVGGITKYYGYTKIINGVEETFFKNISLVNNKTDENLASYFNAPVFESSRVLSISANKDKLLDDYTQVLVTLAKDFAYYHALDENTDKAVTMAGSDLWMYQVNNRTDDEALVFQKKNGADLFTFKLNQSEPNVLESKTAAPVITDDGSGLGSLSFMKKENEKTSLYLNLQLTDVTGGSGPASFFNILYERVMEDDYTSAANGDDIKGCLPFEYIVSTSEDAIYKGELPLTLPKDGIYRLYFDFTDRSGNHLYWPDGAETIGSKKGFYVTQDTGIQMFSTITDVSDSSGIKIKLEWTKVKDHVRTELKYKKKSESQWSTTEKFDSESNKVYSSLELDTDYEFELVNYDYAGNSQVIPLSQKSADWTEFSVSGIPNKTFYFPGESFDKTGLTATAKLSNGKNWAVSNYTNDLGTAISTGKTVTLSYTYNGKTMTATVPATYYIAGAKTTVLTESPVKLKNYSGTLSGGTYYKFGDFPQTIASNQSSSFYTSEPVYNGWYLGSDGYFYAKCGENYFKVEPIKWRVLNPSVSGNKILLAENILTRHMFRNSTDRKNNYMDSDIRSYLNNGFLNTAFNTYAQDLIVNTTVDNSAASTNPASNPKQWGNGYNSYACENTVDKIFLLSLKEATDSAYGFNVEGEENSRIRRSTDYANAIPATGNISFWWLRSPYYGQRDFAIVVWDSGKLDITYREQGTHCINPVYYTNGVVPALCVSTLP